MYKSTLIVACIFLTALSFFASGCNSQKRSVDLYVDAVMLADANEKEKAIDKLKSAVKADKEFTIAYSLMGEIYQQLSDYPKSAKKKKKAVSLNPWSFRDYLNLGRAYQSMNKIESAAKVYTTVCELRPQNYLAHYNAAKCYYEIKDYNNAMTYGAMTGKINPDTSELQKLLGDIYDSRKDYPSATNYYRRALELDANDPDIMSSLAVAYLRTNQNEAAKGLLKSLIEIQPNNSKAYMHLGYCNLVLQEVDDSISNYEKAVALEGNDWDARRGLGVAYILKGKKPDGTIDEQYQQKAVEQFKKSLEINPDQPRRETITKLMKQYSK